MSEDLGNNNELQQQFQALQNCLDLIRSSLKSEARGDRQELIAEIADFSVKLSSYLDLNNDRSDRNWQNFAVSLKSLHRLHTTNYENFEKLFRDYLQTGCEIFALETGIISKIIDRSYIIIAVKSDLEFLQPQLEFPLENTYCEAVVNKQQTITYINVGNIAAMKSHPVYQNLKLESYISTPIFIDGKVYGTLNFSSTKIRNKEFSDREKETIELMAQSISKYIIIEQKEKALRESEARFRMMADSAPIMIWMSDISGNRTFFNRTWLEFTGKSLPPESNFNWAEYLHPDERDFSIVTYLSAFKNRNSFEIEYRLQRKDGQYRWILEKGVPRFTLAKNFVGYIGSCLDITEHKLSLEQLQKQHQRSQLFQEVSHQIRQCLSVKEILATAVSEIQKLLDVDRVLIIRLQEDCPIAVEEAECGDCRGIKGQAIIDALMKEDYLAEYREGKIVAISDLDKTFQLLNKQIETKNIGVKACSIAPIFTKEKLWGLLAIYQCDRPRQWQEFDIQLAKELADRIGSGIAFAELLENLEDLVARRTAQLSQANRNLQQQIAERTSAENQLRIITDTIPALIAYVDCQQRYLFNNKAYQDWFKKSPSQIRGMHVWEVVGGKYYQKIAPAIAKALSGEKVSSDNLTIDRNGKRRWVNATYIPDFAKNGRVKGFFALTIDITERKAIEEMKNEFIAVISHELRTPLTSIHGSLKLLATGKLGNLAPEGQQMLAIADSNTDRLVRLIQDILDLQRMESGQIRIEKQLCNAKILIQQAIDSTVTLANSQGIILLGDRADVNFYADPDYILQVLTNLIANGIKFSDRDSVVEIGARASQSGSEVIFAVKDTGRGIPRNKLKSIFGRFQQVDASDSRAKGGTGLGLAICRTIVELHGGKIWAESILGCGSTFYFTIAIEPR